MPVSDGSKEQIKLRATFINNLAVGFFLVGFLGPVMANMRIYDRADYSAEIVGIFCVAFSVILHIMATRHLAEIDGGNA